MDINVNLTSQSSLIRVLDNNQISLELKKPISSASFKLSFDDKVFEYLEGSVVSLLKTNKVDTSTPGEIIYESKINGGQGSKKIGFTFKALQESKTTIFKITNLVLDNEPSEQEPELILNTLPFQVTGAEAEKVVDDTHNDDEE